MRIVGGILAATALLAVAGCAELLNQREQPVTAMPIAYGPKTEKQVERELQRYSAAMLAMDANAIANMYAPDGVWERQSGPLKGRDAIRAALASTGGVRVLSNEMTMTYLSYNGPAVVQSGEFKQSSRLPDGRVVDAAGRFEATWIHGSNGEWWIRRMVVQPAK
jgi:uncharacterized protein (TIGR02246 family)